MAILTNSKPMKSYGREPAPLVDGPAPAPTSLSLFISAHRALCPPSFQSLSWHAALQYHAALHAVHVLSLAVPTASTAPHALHALLG